MIVVRQVVRIRVSSVGVIVAGKHVGFQRPDMIAGSAL
jgi:hypothetical protein